MPWYCSFSGLGLSVGLAGRCSAHYTALQLHGSPGGPWRGPGSSLHQRLGGCIGSAPAQRTEPHRLSRTLPGTAPALHSGFARVLSSSEVFASWDFWDTALTCRIALAVAS